MATLTQTMKEKALPILDQIYNDGFIQGVIRGDISKEAVAHYLRADSLYLDSFVDIYGMLISKCTTKEDKKFFHAQIDFILNQEVDAHKVMANYVGLPYEEVIKGGAWYPSADHYIKHMFYNVYANSLAETIAAMAPCPWVYLMIARRIVAEHQIAEDHPLRDWIYFYTGDFIDEIMHELDRMVEKFAATATEEEKQRLVNNFVQSCEHERNFFNMAYTQERWLVEA
ncbi:thiaminase II [Aerococcaceae bacterium NML210727]|nr:thiaminase II [Aerococcaceae bacterium NML210727]MCW6653919.1 thiaminase II [Aerococcaceae bacterium NML201296]MCW6660944.1 thiaminase II [Aerococcaceae bacterium NML201209]MCW6663052.1 thiaminase II [Aerococcaceae bacterium NML190073]MCW6681725.1 thiaminase II [Aerococcaceae bacterium NML160702]